MAVAVREGLYVLVTLVGLVRNPAFLPVNVLSSWTDDEGNFDNKGNIFIAMYVLAPEKFVARAAFDWSNHDFLLNTFWFGGALLDLNGVAALVAGLLSHGGLVPALAVGYGATTLGGLFVICTYLYSKI